MVRLLRLLLLPFSLVYGAVIMVRNFLYDAGLLSVTVFRNRVIVIGNLVAGGAGKSPMTEYLVRLLRAELKVSVLSRGYGRKTTGYREVELNDTADSAGDEPLQFKTKFPNIRVSVSEKRVPGIQRLLPHSDVVVLDDAFQHRAVCAGLNILLFDYHKLFDVQMLLPSGDLREPLSARRRAEVIVVTKTPPQLSNDEMNRIHAKVSPLAGQELFFSYLDYGELTSLHTGATLPVSDLKNVKSVLLLTGIANAEPLRQKLAALTSVVHHRYPDHHRYTRKNIAKLAAATGASTWIITTEKDAQRLRSPELEQLLAGLSVFYLPVEARIHQPGEARFNQIIRDYVANRH